MYCVECFAVDKPLADLFAHNTTHGEAAWEHLELCLGEVLHSLSDTDLDFIAKLGAQRFDLFSHDLEASETIDLHLLSI